MSSSRKKVVIRTNAGDILAGYLPLSGFVQNGLVDLLDLSGRVLPIPLVEVKMVCFVRDFNTADAVNPERLTRRAFLARPRTEGLWLRLTFTAGDQLEGLAPLDLSLLSSAVEDRGIYLIPPDIRSNTQRILVPHAALSALQLLAVITTPSKSAAPAKPATPTLQEDLFPLSD